MSDDKPQRGTPEFEAWLRDKLKQRADELFNADIPEELHDVGIGRSVGPEKADDLSLEKTIAEDIAIDKEQKRRHLKRIK